MTTRTSTSRQMPLVKGSSSYKAFVFSNFKEKVESETKIKNAIAWFKYSRSKNVCAQDQLLEGAESLFKKIEGKQKQTKEAPKQKLTKSLKKNYTVWVEAEKDPSSFNKAFAALAKDIKLSCKD